MQIRKKELSALKESAKKINALIAAANGNESTCAVFDSTFKAEFTDEQKRAVKLYVQTWIGEPLKAAIAGIEGDRSFANESCLDTVNGWGARSYV